MFAAGQAPDEGAVARIVFLNAGFLFDHLRAVEAEARLTRHQQVAAQARCDAHAAKAADRARRDADHRAVLTQRSDACMDLSDGGEAKVGLLQPHAARLKDDHSARGNAVAVVFRRQLQRACDLGAGDLTHAAALEGAFNGEHHGGLAAKRAACDDHTIIGLRDDALARQPRGGQLLERIKQFTEGARVEQRDGSTARIAFDKAVAFNRVA